MITDATDLLAEWEPPSIYRRMLHSLVSKLARRLGVTFDEALRRLAYGEADMGEALDAQLS